MRPEPSNHLDPRAVSAWRLSTAVGLAVPCVAGAVAIVALTAGGIFTLTTAVLAFVAAAAIVAVALIVAPKIRYERWRYEVTEDEVDLREGVLIVKRTLIPLVRVQHVDTHQGPIMRSLGLAGVKIATAAGPHEIPALSVEAADELRDRISALARVATDDV